MDRPWISWIFFLGSWKKFIDLISFLNDIRSIAGLIYFFLEHKNINIQWQMFVSSVFSFSNQMWCGDKKEFKGYLESWDLCCTLYSSLGSPFLHLNVIAFKQKYGSAFWLKPHYRKTNECTSNINVEQKLIWRDLVFIFFS